MTAPLAFDILLEECRLTRYDHHIERRLSSFDGQYSDSAVLKVPIDEAMLQRLAVVAGALCQPALPAALGGG